MDFDMKSSFIAECGCPVSYCITHDSKDCSFIDDFPVTIQVDQVVDVMRDNVNKVLERDVKLGELDARAENLEAASNSFATSAKRVRKKMWWENLKMKLIIGGVVLAVLIIIITIIAVKVSFKVNFFFWDRKTL